MIGGEKKYDIYKGYWKNGKKHGDGEKINADESKFKGEYENDMPKKGRYEWSDNEYYDGEWEGGYFHGKGKKVMIKKPKNEDGTFVISKRD